MALSLEGFVQLDDALVPEPEEDAYLLNRGSGSTVLMSRDGAGTDSLSYSLPTDVSADGSFVAFYTRSALSTADTDAEHDVYVYDTLADSHEVATLEQWSAREFAPQ